MLRAIAVALILASPVISAVAFARDASAQEPPESFDLDCVFGPPELHPGEGAGANISLTSRMGDEVLIWNVGIQFDWMGSHQHIYDQCAT